MKVTINAYSDDLFKVVYLKHNSGKKRVWYDELPEGGSGGGCSEEKELCNLYRAKSKVREYALCNDWQFFVTLTLDKRKQDRYDLDGYVKDLGVWVGNYNKKYNTKLEYLLIPEQHQDGAWHMHGLFRGVALDSLSENEYGYQVISYYANRFGYISLSAVRDGKKTASYITKYVAKAFGHTEVGLCKHSYYHSHGLCCAEKIGEIACDIIPENVWQNEHCGIEWLSLEELQKRVKELEKNDV